MAMTAGADGSPAEVNPPGLGPVNPKLLRIQDSTQTHEATGVLVEKVSTEVRYKPQWLEIWLYRLHDGTGRYVLQYIGRSVAYHRLDSPCNTGVPTLVSDESFPRDAEPCKKCRPADIHDLSVKDLGKLSFELETNRFKVVVADSRELSYDEADEPALWEKSAQLVVETLREWPPRGPRRPVSGIVSGSGLSAPAQRLLDMASAKDPYLAAAVRRVVRLLWQPGFSDSQHGQKREGNWKWERGGEIGADW